MYGYKLTSHWIIPVILCCLVKNCHAQIQVNVSYVPESPVEMGVVTFRCYFELAAGDTLAEQYWQIVNGARIFTYVPGNPPTIDPDYQDKIIAYRTDDTSYLVIDFNVTACDTEQYLCHILSVPSADEGQAQESLEVINLVEPVMRYNGRVITDDEEITLSENATVSCHLNNAGPPLPEILELEVTGGELNSKSSADYTQYNTTCTWSYDDPVQLEVPTNISKPHVLTCRVQYRLTGSNYSAEITLIPDACLSDPCLNGGTCSSEIQGNDTYFECTCPDGFSGEICESDICDSDPCLNNGTCTIIDGNINCVCIDDVYGDFCDNDTCLGHSCVNSTCSPWPSDDSNLDYTCNCVGNRFGGLCNITGCDWGPPEGCYCNNSGVCIDTFEECYCDCPSGCNGTSCEIFDAGDLCTDCVNQISCTQNCSFFYCECDWNANGTLCDQSCSLESDSTSEPGEHIVATNESITLYCDSEENTVIYWVDENFNLVANGTNLTFSSAVEADEGTYYCRIEGPDCNQQLEYNLIVDIPDFELSPETPPYNETSVKVGESFSKVTEVTSVVSEFELLELTSSAAFQPSRNAAFQSSRNALQTCPDDINGYIEVNRSTTGEVSIFINETTKAHEGDYVTMVIYNDYVECIRTVVLAVDEDTVDGEDDGDGLSGGAIAGIVIGVLVLVALVGACVFFFVFYKNRERNKKNENADKESSDQREKHELRENDEVREPQEPLKQHQQNNQGFSNSP